MESLKRRPSPKRKSKCCGPLRDPELDASNSGEITLSPSQAEQQTTFISFFEPRNSFIKSPKKKKCKTFTPNSRGWREFTFLFDGAHKVGNEPVYWFILLFKLEKKNRTNISSAFDHRNKQNGHLLFRATLLEQEIQMKCLLSFSN